MTENKTKQTADAFIQVTIPNYFPTGDTHCYLVPGIRGWSLIDAGVNTDLAKETWVRELDKIGIRFQDITSIYLSHNHPDHCGLAGWFQQQSGAQVFMSSPDIGTLAIYGLPVDEQYKLVNSSMGLHGIPQDFLKLQVQDIQMLEQLFEPHAELTPLDDGAVIFLDNQEFEVIRVPGHTDGHISFYSIDSGLLISGDTLLNDRVSQISDWPYTMLSNPLEAHIKGLERLAELQVTLVLPAHGPYFTDVTGRKEAAMNQHNRRMSKVLRTLDSNLTLCELCLKIGVAARVLQEMRVSWADTLGYLEYLHHQGKICRIIDHTIKFGPV
ncbi:MAG: MBL fold metallo-hydrolase [Candidatus Saccharibacteria bacterium]